MIDCNDKGVLFKGSRVEITAEYLQITDALLKFSPETVLSVFYKRGEKLKDILPSTNSEVLKAYEHLIDVIDKGESDNEQRNNQ